MPKAASTRLALVALVATPALAACGHSATATQHETLTPAAVQADVLSAPTGLTASQEGPVLHVRWRAPAAPPTSYRLWVNGADAVTVPPTATDYRVPLTPGQREYFVQLQSVWGEESSYPATATVRLPGDGA